MLKRKEKIMKALLIVLIVMISSGMLFAQAGADSTEVFVDRKDSFTVVGLELLNSMDNNKMMELWTRFTAEQEQIKNQVPSPYYGINFYTKDYNPETNEGYGYMAAVEVTDATSIPAGFVSRKIAASDYAVFTHTGPIDGIGALYGYIFGEWMQTTTLKPKMQEVFEVYGCDYNPESDDNSVQIWVPVYK